MRLRPACIPFVVVMLLGIPAPVATGQIYDMGPMLDEPHPFDVPTAPKLRRPTQPGYTGRLYDMGPMLDEPHPFDIPAPLPRTLQAPPDVRAATPAPRFSPSP